MRKVFITVFCLLTPSVVLAAPGDAIVVETIEVTLTAAQRAALGTYVASLWNGSAANVLGISCYRPELATQPNLVRCSLSGRKTMTPTAALQSLVNGEPIQIVGRE